MSAYTALKLTEAFGELSNLHKIIRVLQTSFPMLANVITGVRGAMEAGFTATQTFKIALSGLWDVIKAHPIIALTAAVVAVASAIGFAQKKAEEARQQQAEKNKEVIDTYNQEQESLENLISKYKELANNDRTDSSNREAIKNVQDEITKLVKEQAENLDLVNGKLDDELQKLNEISKTNQESATAAFRSAFTSEYDKWGSTYFNSSDNSFFGGIHRFLGIDNNNRISTKGGFWNSQDKLLTTEQDRALRELIEEIYSRRGETFKGSTNDFYLSENPSERIKELREIVNLLGDVGATESEQFKDFSSYLTAMEEMMSSSVEATNNLMKNLLGVKLNSVDTVSKLNNISSLDEYSSMRDSLISELSDDSQIKQALSQGFISKESIEKFVDDTLSTLPQISTYYNQWVSKFKDTSKKAGNTVKIAFSDLIADKDFKKKVDEYKDKLKELDEALEKLRSGDLGEEDRIKLFEDFPELAGQADNLDEAIVNLISDTEDSVIADFNDQLDNMDTDESRAALNALKNSLLGLAKTAGNDVDIERINEIINHLETKESCDNIDELTEKMKSYADEYNRLVGYGKKGNVDYNKRPVVSKEDVKAVYPEFNGDHATTYDQGYQIADSSGKEYAIVVTPILENGKVLSQKELDDYINNVLKGSDDILEADTQNLVIHAEAEGEGDYWIKNDDGSLEFDFEKFNEQLIPAKEGHLEAYLDVNTNIDDLIPYAEKLGISVEQLLQMRDVPSALFNSAEETTANIKKLKTALDDLSGAYSNMKSIIDDYNENGYLTLDNLQSIMDMQPEYINLLINENGQINLNNQAYKEYVASKAKSLLINELQDLYNSILGMKVEEAQAYANAEAYNAETRSVKDLLAATTELYLIKAKQKDLANNTTVYTDAMSRSFNTAANYAAMVDSYINSLSTSQNEFSVSTEQATSALEAEKDALEAQKDALNDSKDALEDYKDGLSDAQSKIKDLIDLVQDYIKQMKENEMDALSDQIDALEEQKDNYSEIISQKKEAIELAKQEREEAEKLSDLQQAVAKDTLSLAVANLDDSSAGRKAQKVAKDKLIQSNKDLQDELNQQAYDKRIEALEQDEEDYSNHIDKRIEALNKEKDAIQEYLDNVRQLYEDACNMIDNDTGDLYGKLWNDYVYPYTTQTRAEFDNLWYSAQEAIQRYIGDNNSLIGVMEYLQTEIYNTDEQIGELELQIGDLETAIDNTNSMIDNTSTSIDNVSTSLDGLGTTIADYMAQLAELQAAANNIDVNPNPGGDKTKFWVTHNGKTYETGYNYNGDTEGNRLLAAAELTKQIAKDVSGFDQYGLGIVQGYLGVGTSGAKEWYVDLNGHRYTAVSKTKDNAIKQIMAQGIDPRAGYYVRDHIQHYATGTYSSVGGVAITQENNKLEEIFGKLQNGQYTMLSEGSHVLDSQATTNLHRFADNPPEFVAQALNYSGYLGKVENAARNVVRNIDNHSSGNTEVSAPISISIQGDASQSTVKAIEKAGREIETRIIKKLVRFGNINKKPMY